MRDMFDIILGLKEVQCGDLCNPQMHIQQLRENQPIPPRVMISFVFLTKLGKTRTLITSNSILMNLAI